jgi:PadR family transcriptional regulator, regulatory protein PadR
MFYVSSSTLYCIVLKFYSSLCYQSKLLQMETQENIKSQLKKGVLELCILSVVHTSDEVYPSDIIDQLRHAEMQIPEGTLYPILTRLKNAGYLQYRWVESTEGPPRKYFTLTPLGEQYQQQLQLGWIELSKSVNQIISTKHN